MGSQRGSIVRWLKSVGDYAKVGEALVEVNEAGVSDVISAPQAGYLFQILVKEGGTVPIQTPLCLIDTRGESQIQAKPFQGGQIVPQPALTDLSQVNTEQQVSPKETEIPLSGVRGVIAQHMTDSLRYSAQFTITMQADVTELLQQHKALKAVSKEMNATEVSSETIHATLTDMIIKITALTLKDHPRLNGWVKDEVIHLPAGIHIGLAVAIEGGLIVPVIKNADRKTLHEIAADSKQLAQKAQKRTLSFEEISGSTFTISNMGMYGVDIFTPIINPPEVAILGIGAVNDYPLKQVDNLVWRKGLPLSLTIDHRAVDGAPAAAFLRDLKDRLSQIDLNTL